MSMWLDWSWGQSRTLVNLILGIIGPKRDTSTNIVIQIILRSMLQNSTESYVDNTVSSDCQYILALPCALISGCQVLFR